MRGALALGLAGLAACSSGKTIKLPTQPDAELAFAILYDDARIAEIGDVVRASALYSGAYAVSGDGSGYEARVFFVTLADLTSAAEAACATLDDAAARRSCLDQASRCADAPTSCLKAVRAEEGCGDRRSLPDDFPVEAYADKDGRLEPQSGGADGAKLCGPSPVPTGCPLAIPGYVVTEDGHFRCVAPASQRDCELSVDLSRCAIDPLSGTLGPDGNLSNVRGRCSAEPLAPSDQSYSGAPGIAIVCDDRRFVASTMGLLFATASCPHQGPGSFNSWTTYGGRITGIGVTGRSAANQKLVLSGGGYDQCASSGCSSRSNCVDLCDFSCHRDFLLDECATNEWPTCTGLIQADDCNARCLKWCERTSDCYADTSGGMFTLGPVDAPEQETDRLPLPGTALGASAMLALPNGSFLIATSRSVVLVSAEASEASELTRQPVAMDINGIVAISNTEAIAFGAQAGVAQLARIQIDQGTPALIVQAPTPVADLAQIDGAAIFGSGRDWIAVYAQNDRSEVRALPIGGGSMPSPTTLPGKPTSIITLPGGDVVVGVRGNDQRHALVRFAASSSGLGAPLIVSTIVGLEPSVLALSPASCAGNQPSACRVLVGFRRSERPGSPLIGVAIENDTAPQSFHLTPALVEVAMPDLDLLFATDTSLWAGASYHNRVMPLVLER